MVTTSTRTILVIDDDPDIRGDLRMILEDHGYRVLTAHDGKAGLDAAITEQPDLVIVDMMMPRMSGFAVLERLKQRVDFAAPVVMLTGNESDQQRTLAEFLGVDAYLNKPIGTRQLLEQVCRLCPMGKPASLDGTHIPLETAV